MKRALLRLSGIVLALAMTTAYLSAQDVEWTTWEEADGGNGHEYTILTNQAPWLEHQAAAEELGGYLATLQSVAEHDFIWELLLAAEAAEPWAGEWYAFGLIQDADGEWGWVTGEEYVAADALWGWREPNNRTGEDYGVLSNWRKDYAGYIYWWNDGTNAPYPYYYRAIVEREGGPQDTTAPSTSLDEANPSELPWSDTPLTVQVTGSVTDDLSGLKIATLTVDDEYGETVDDVDVLPLLQEDGSFAAELSLDATTQPGDERTYTISLIAEDNAGNAADLTSLTVTAVGDTTAPVSSLDGADPSELAWSSDPAPVLISGSATDAESGVASAILRVVDEYGVLNGDHAITLEADGSFAAELSLDATTQPGDERTYTISLMAADNAGNAAEPTSLTVTAVGDTTPPVASLDSADPSELSWSADPVPVLISGSATDAESGVASAVLRVVDEYGELNGDHPVTLNADGTFTTTVELTATAWADDDDGDGRRTYAISLIAADNAGNTAESAALEVTAPQDTTAPVLTLESPNPSRLPHDNPNTLKATVISGNAVDSESGIESVTIEVVDEYGEFDSGPDALSVDADGNFSITLYLSSVVEGGDSSRSYDVTVTATDMAGNSVAETVTALAAKPSAGKRPETPPGHGGTPPGHSNRPDNPNRPGR